MTKRMQATVEMVREEGVTLTSAGARAGKYDIRAALGILGVIVTPLIERALHDTALNLKPWQVYALMAASRHSRIVREVAAGKGRRSTVVSPAAVPSAVPRLTRAELAARLAAAGHVIDAAQFPLQVIGIRGYYRDTMGAAGTNDRGIYDDALFVQSPNVTAAFNGNTDPSVFRPAIASLDPGLYFAHRLGLHKNAYQALIQRNGEVAVTRDGGVKERGYFGINIHRGGNISTSSEGCQTIPPSQWDAFIGLVTSEAKRLFGKQWQTQTIPYALLVNA